MKNLISFLLLSLAFHIASAQGFDKDKLDAYFNVLENNNKFMGSVALIDKGKIVYERSLGFTDVETKTKATADSKYRIGSISKTFCSALTFKAVEEKKIRLDTRLNNYYPKIKHADKITIGHLLSHRSGIHNFTDDESYMQWNTQKKTEQELLDIIEKGGSDFEPNSKASYSNSNYVLLSYILQKIYKKEYSEILKEKILTPLQLKNTSVGTKINLQNNEAYSYGFTGEGWEKGSETDMFVPMGAGNIISTPGDLMIFANALFSGKVVSAKSVEQMKTIVDDYGMGLFQFPFYERKSYGHTGGIDGFSSMFGYFIDEQIGFAITSNGSNYENNNIAIALLSAVFNKPYNIPDFKSFTLASEDLDSYLGIYSSRDIPLKMTITKKGNVLFAQATGQSSFPLDATEKHKFKFAAAGVVIEFDPANKTMLLKQGGGRYNFIKD